MMTDRSGNQVKQYGYRAYGDERYNDPAGAYNVSKRFTSQILDYDLDLYYYGARYYDAKLGRFTQADPVIPDDATQNSQALNRYSYCFNNPLKFTDPTGNEPEPIKKKEDEASETAIQDTDKNANSPNGDSSGKKANTPRSFHPGAQGLSTPDGRVTGSGDPINTRSPTVEPTSNPADSSASKTTGDGKDKNPTTQTPKKTDTKNDKADKGKNEKPKPNPNPSTAKEAAEGAGKGTLKVIEKAVPDQGLFTILKAMLESTFGFGTFISHSNHIQRMERETDPFKVLEQTDPCRNAQLFMEHASRSAD